jgi:Flp pilus assembly pilin Flp
MKSKSFLLNLSNIRFFNKVLDNHGATALEYAMIAGLIAAAIVVSATVLGTNINAAFNIYTVGL